MNWKILKKEILKSGDNFNDESKFILGIDIGNSTSTISYWNMNLKGPQLIDISGGYGNPSMPTVIQYIPTNKEWVFGEYALLNRGDLESITFNNLVDRLGTKEFLEIEDKPISIPQLLGRYIKALVENCLNIDPNAEIAGMIVAVPTYISEPAKEELQRAISIAGFEKEFIGFVSARECAIKYYYYQENTSESEKIVMLDYGGRELRGGVFDIVSQKDTLNITALSSIIDNKLCTQNVDNEVKNLFISYYCRQTETHIEYINEATMAQLEAFAYQNRNILFQNTGRTIKVYFNFAFPAFQKSISPKEVSDFIAPLQQRFESFLNSVCTKVITKPINPSQISKVICLGGGFEMKWTKEAVEKIFPASKIVTMKSSKGIISQGACIAAAIELGLITNRNYNIKDFNIINYDIGLKAVTDKKEQFIALIEKGSFWWQKHTEKIFILNCEINDNTYLKIYSRNEFGEESTLAKVELSDLPQRPKRTTRLKIGIDFKMYNVISVNIKDCGFGEFFKATDFEKSAEIKI